MDEYERYNFWTKEINNTKIMEQEKIEYTLQDIVDAVQYGFNYRVESQNDGKAVPLGNTLQWLMAKKDLLFVPQEFKEFQEKNKK